MPLEQNSQQVEPVTPGQAPNLATGQFELRNHDQSLPIEPPAAALYPPDKSVPFPGYRQFLHDRRQVIFEDQSHVWDLVETGGSLWAGGWAATKFGPEFATPVTYTVKGVPAATKALIRDKAIAGAFGATACSSLLSFGVDHLLAPQDMKMECTVASDWLIQPVISIFPMPWKSKVCLMLVTHELGRLIDHYRQPKQNF